MTADRRKVLTGGAAMAASLSLPAVWRGGMAAEAIRLGCILPLSGVAEVFGRAAKVGAEIAVDQINAEGGVDGRPIEITFLDDRGVPNNSIAAARELRGRGTNLLLGSPLTSTAMALIGILPSIGAVLLCTGAGGNNLTNELFIRNFFRVSDNTFTRANGMAKVLAERYPTVTKWTGINTDSASGNDAWATFLHCLNDFYPKVANKNVEVVPPIATRPGATDFRAQIIQFTSSGAEGILVSLIGSETITFFEQARSLGLTDKVKILVDFSTELDIAKAMKDRVPGNLWSITFWNHSAQKGNPVNDALVAETVRRTGDSEPPGITALGHAAVLSYAAAIKRAGATETDAVIPALEKIRIESAKGSFYFRKEDHQSISGVDYIKFGPSNAPPGWEITEFVHQPTIDVVNPPTPGVAMKL